MRLINLKQGSLEWLKFRNEHICASDAPIIMGHSPWKNWEQLIEEKIFSLITPSNSYMERGKQLEPLALEAFENEMGLSLFPMVGKHETLDWMAASFDGITLERDIILEIKCPGKKDHAEAKKGNIPEKYKAQLQHQIFVSGLDFSYYYSFDGEKGIVLEVKRDNEFIEKMIEKEKEFWECLKAHKNNLVVGYAT